MLVPHQASWLYRLSRPLRVCAVLMEMPLHAESQLMLKTSW